ncbi:hypothetical protein IAT38_007408 [Cryptococcus sp. DSM 104549]
MSHTLVTYILKNPPKKKEKGKKGGKKGMAAEANVGGPMVFEKAAAEDGSGEEDTSPAPAPDQGGVPTKGTEIDAILGRSDPVLGDPDAAEQASKKLAKLDLAGDEDEDEDEDTDSPYAQLGAWLEENKAADDAAIVGQIKELGIAGKHTARSDTILLDTVASAPPPSSSKPQPMQASTTPLISLPKPKPRLRGRKATTKEEIEARDLKRAERVLAEAQRLKEIDEREKTEAANLAKFIKLSEEPGVPPLNSDIKMIGALPPTAGGSISLPPQAMIGSHMDQTHTTR